MHADMPPMQPRILHLPRHPQPEDRPCFTKLEEQLSADDTALLEDGTESKEDPCEEVVHVLGGNVVTGQYIYPTLQNKYLYDMDRNNSL